VGTRVYFKEFFTKHVPPVRGSGAVVSGVVLKKEVVILFNFFFFQGPRGGVLKLLTGRKKVDDLL